MLAIISCLCVCAREFAVFILYVCVHNAQALGEIISKEVELKANSADCVFASVCACVCAAACVFAYL